MTEKVISLSGGLALGMVFALFLGIGATQSIDPSSRFEIPSILQMTIAQHTHGPATPDSNTAPASNTVAPNIPDRGRITRIATLEVTTDPVLGTTATASNEDPKDWAIASTPKIESALQRNNLQRSYIALNSSSNTYASLGQTVGRESNFAAIATSSAGRNNYSGGSTPSGVEGKPQTQGGPPSVAHNNPDEGHGDDPATSAKTEKPGSGPDSEQGNNNDRVHVEPEGSGHSHHPSFGGSSWNENDQGGRPSIGSRPQRPETY